MQALKRGADNDQNAFLIARLIGAKALYIITNTNGVYQELDNADSRITSISFKELTDGFIKKIAGGKSKNGTGGMQSKLEVAREAAKVGIETYIINGTDSRLLDHYRGNHYGGTIISPA
jgi:glutamate 5-kinase